ncbi:MAG: NAD-dependent epimerase/dehydratase family protein [Candidatus Hermodarchaeota archaeon]
MIEKKILVTGANGYIGSYFVENYKSREFSIIPLVRELPNHFKKWKEQFQLIECDITNLEQLKKRVPEVDYIIHLAAYNDVLTKIHPDKALLVNAIGTRNILEVAKEKECKHFIYFSTLQVYGKELEGIITPESKIDTHNDYALTHYIAELYCKMFALHFGINVSILRPSNVFGAPVNININRWSLVPLCFCKSAFETSKIILTSSGKQNRDFIDLDQIIKSIDYLIKNYEEGYKIYNISSESTFSIAEVAEIVHTVALSQLNDNIELIIKGNLPHEANKFKVINNLLAPSNKEVIKDRLIQEITKIFKLLKKG